MMKDVLTALLVNAAVFSALFIIMLIVRRLLGKRFSPVLTLILWVVVVFKLLIPYGLESDFSLFTPSQTAAAVPADTSTGAHIGQPVSRDNISFDKTEPVAAGDGSNLHLDTQVPSYQTTSPIPEASFDWTMLAFCVWAAGAAAVVTVFCIGSLNIRRRIRHARLQTPERLSEVFEECRALLGVKRRVGLCVQSALRMPVMMGVCRPCLVLPENALTLDKKTLRHIMLHELSHLKRGDLLLICTLNLLSAVYWFNSLTWLCFKLIRDDIETACDHSVFAAVGHLSRLDYIDTLLYFAGSDKQQRLAAAMALSHRRSAMEKRIAGMFKTARTHTAGRCAAVCVAVLMLCASVLTACQPTPAAPVVVNKADGKLEEKISQTAEPQAKYEAPAKVQDTLTKKNVTVSIDADVIVPDVPAFPVYEVKPVGFTQQQVNAVGKALLGDKALFSLPEGEKIYMTKEDVLEQIAKEKAQLEEVKKMGDKEFNNVFDGESREDAYAGYEQRIKEWEEQYKTAPDVWGKDKLPATLDILKNDYGEGFKVYAESDNGDFPCFYVSNGNYEELGETTAYMMFEAKRSRHSAFSRIKQGTPEDVSVSREDAIAQAEKLVQGMGISDMAVAYIGITDSFIEGGMNTAKETQQCWGVRFERVMDGIPVSAITASHASDSATPPEDNTEYVPTYSPESLFVAVGDEGILGFEWSNVAEVTAKRSDNVELLPFDDVMERAKDHLFYKIYAEEDIAVEMSIKQVKLSLMRIGKRDDSGTFLIVPVWDFIGDMRRTFPEGDEWLDNDLSFLTLNAIDGSVIDREKGY